ncbi:MULTISPECIES: type II toxin-antitoxin system RelE/ParE family toxin [unclassified Aureimonas]|uniref:type II toxin-antitoxin system RelE/ParE family toxin n=1 Tax=unclassified Aureimonas TaxID=2615206 RepID=UPI0006F93876|nr:MULTISPECIES: type II toxin-antitoxin system RelE/ParE family toxin [unclassified Aureimonas]KQT53882.1 plasmid stabilization protein [Aureimonas sp. Leaf427]KQT71676.1 plasmid stabilization protein [Aureimonas sp. Leaf460]
MRRLLYTKEAQADLVSILTHVARTSGSVETGRRVVDRIRTKCRKFASLPGMMGRTRPEIRPDLRSVAIGRYVVFMRYHDRERLEIVAIVEGHRDIDAYFHPQQ